MARTDNLTNFLTDVASAIKTKKASEVNILASQFDTEILNLPSQGEYQEKTVTPTTSGLNVVPDANYDAMTKVVVNPVTSAIDANIQAGNIKKDIEILGVTGTYAGEDLTSVINAQDQVIAELQASLEDKSMGIAKPYLFVQMTEPSKKDGIWFQTNGSVDHYIIDDSVYTAGNWSAVEDTTQVPYSCDYGAATNIGTDIYIFGASSYSSAQKTAYKYDTLTDTYTQLTDIPKNFNMSPIAAIGTDIYLFGGNTASYNDVYKYDTLTDTYTKMSNPSSVSSFGSSSATTLGNNIYLTGGSLSNYIYKYNPSTDEFTQIGMIPSTTTRNRMVAVGTDLYIFGSTQSGTSSAILKAYKYDTLIDTYTELADLPESLYYGTISAVGTDIYLFSSSNNVYKYNISTNAYTQLINSPISVAYGNSVTIGTDIYVLCSTDNRIYHIQDKSYEYDNLVIIAQSRYYVAGHKTKLLNTVFDGTDQPIYWFVDAWYYTLQDGLQKTIPVYYGNGTEWINFKNPPVSE